MARHPHPMLYPLQDLPPEEMAQRHSDPDMRKAYRILWENTLSYLAKRPWVRERRALFSDGEHLFACMGAEIIEPGWLRYQDQTREAPESPVPSGGLMDPLPLGAKLEKPSVQVEPRLPGVETDTMITWLADHRVASPGTLSTILARMQGAGLIDWPDSGRITLSEKGNKIWKEAKAEGLDLSSAVVLAFRAHLDDLESGQVDRQTAANFVFHSLGLDLQESLDWMDVEGIQQEIEVSTEAGNETLTDDLGYPPSIDPGLRLPKDAPERLARQEREQRLANRWLDRWRWMAPRQRAVLRLLEMARERSGQHDHWIRQSRFDVLLRWEIGLPANELGIEPEEIPDDIGKMSAGNRV